LKKDSGFKRIAVEEVFAIGFNSLMGYYLDNSSERWRADFRRRQGT